MRLVTYSRENFTSCGILDEDSIIDIPSNWNGPNPPRDVKQILERGPACLEIIAKIAKSAKALTALDSVKLLAPIPHPNKVLALAGNYSEHIKEVGTKLGLSESSGKTTVPRPFLKPSTVVIGPDEQIQWPDYSEQIDHELELAVIIGRKAKFVSEENALDFVAGYTICNDISARSTTFAKNRMKRPWDEFYDWLNGKWADCFLPLGPYLLTADEIGDVQNLNMFLSVNGQIRQQANTSQMIFPVAYVVSFLSHLMTLEPGDVIATGTPAGVAAATGKFLNEGDLITCTIDRLGSLSNTLSKKPEKFFQPLE